MQNSKMHFEIYYNLILAWNHINFNSILWIRTAISIPIQNNEILIPNSKFGFSKITKLCTA